MAKDDKNPYPKIVEHVDTAFLHQAIMIAGKTESTINMHRIPAIKALGWDSEGFLRIYAIKSHRLPAAAVAQTILVE